MFNVLWLVSPVVLLVTKMWGSVRGRRREEPEEVLEISMEAVLALEAQAAIEENTALRQQLAERELKLARQGQELDETRRRLLALPPPVAPQTELARLYRTREEAESRADRFQRRCDEQALAIRELKKRVDATSGLYESQANELAEVTAALGGAVVGKSLAERVRDCVEKNRKACAEINRLRTGSRVKLADANTQITLDQDLLTALGQCQLGWKFDAIRGGKCCSIQDFMQAAKKLAEKDAQLVGRVKNLEESLAEAEKMERLHREDAAEVESDLLEAEKARDLLKAELAALKTATPERQWDARRDCLQFRPEDSVVKLLEGAGIVPATNTQGRHTTVAAVLQALEEYARRVGRMGAKLEDTVGHQGDLCASLWEILKSHNRHSWSSLAQATRDVVDRMVAAEKKLAEAQKAQENIASIKGKWSVENSTTFAMPLASYRPALTAEEMALHFLSPILKVFSQEAPLSVTPKLLEALHNAIAETIRTTRQEPSSFCAKMGEKNERANLS